MYKSLADLCKTQKRVIFSCSACFYPNNYLKIDNEKCIYQN